MFQSEQLTTLLDRQGQPLPLLHVERPYVLDLESRHVILLPQTSVAPYKNATLSPLHKRVRIV
jgi:hypothetical protein